MRNKKCSAKKKKKKPISFRVIAEDITSILADRRCSRLHHSNTMAFGEVFVFRFVSVKVTLRVAKRSKAYEIASESTVRPIALFLYKLQKMIFHFLLYALILCTFVIWCIKCKICVSWILSKCFQKHLLRYSKWVPFALLNIPWISLAFFFFLHRTCYFLTWMIYIVMTHKIGFPQHLR